MGNYKEYQAISDIGLTELQLKFVEEYVKLGGMPGAPEKAAKLAGYAHDSAASQGYALLRNNKILKALKLVAEGKAQAGVILGMDTLIELCQSGPAPVRLKAATELLDRGGMMLSKVDTLNINVNDNRTIEEVRKEINRLAVDLGIDLKAPVIEGEYTATMANPLKNDKGGRPWKKQLLIPGKVRDAERAALNLQAEVVEEENFAELEV